MPTLLNLEANRTYATRENAIKAVERVVGKGDDGASLKYFIYTTPEGRFFPVFVGERAILRGMHFHFNVVA